MENFNIDRGFAIFDIQTLDNLFDFNPNMFGLAFAIEKDQRETVNLNVLRCYYLEQTSGSGLMKVVKEPTVIARGSTNNPSTISAPIDPVSKYKFEFIENIPDKFAFALLMKEQFKVLFMRKTQNIFISGAMINFGSLVDFGGECFTFTTHVHLAAPIPGDEGLPTYQVLLPCPPEWYLNSKNIQDPNINFWVELRSKIEEALEFG